MMKKLEKYSNQIENDCGLKVNSIKKAGEGDNSIAFIINEEYIFRFPKRREAKKEIQKEICILPLISTFLDLAIPRFQFISSTFDFVGYRIIPGEPFSNSVYLLLSDGNKKKIQKMIVKFLHSLHNTDTQLLKNCKLETMNLKEEYEETYELTHKMIDPYLSKGEKKIIDKYFSEYLNNPQNFNYVPKLIHNDFSKDHILFDEPSKKITGIIDFGDIALGDPDYDFLYLLDEFGEDFLSKVLSYYQHTGIKKILPKLYFFILACKLQIILGSIKENDDDELKIVLKDLKQWIKRRNNFAF